MKSIFLYALLPAIHLVCAIPAAQSTGQNTGEGKTCIATDVMKNGVCTSENKAPSGYVLLANSKECSSDGSTKCKVTAPMCDQGGERRSYCINSGQMCGTTLLYECAADGTNCQVQSSCTEGQQNCNFNSQDGYNLSYQISESSLCPENLRCCRLIATPFNSEAPSSELHADATLPSVEPQEEFGDDSQEFTIDETIDKQNLDVNRS